MSAADLRAARVLVAVVSAWVVGAPGCADPTGSECVVATDCAIGESCVDGVCESGGIVPVGEGEGDVGEGEGEKGEGEGDEGEGEGDLAGEGEGEGDVVVGEGEGDLAGEGEGEGDLAGEGEGEGDGGNTCSPSCGSFQECVSNRCVYVGDVCDAFQSNFTFGVDQSFDTSLDVNAGTNVYAHFERTVAGDFLLDAYGLNSTAIDAVASLIRADLTPPAAGLRFDVTSADFDPYIGVFDDSAGQCQNLDSNDDFAGSSSHSRIDMPLSFLDGSANLLVSTFDPNDAGNYTITTKPLLCGEEVDSAATFNLCGRALATTTNLCETNNPCERDVNNQFTGRFCCISTNATANGAANNCGRHAGEAIFTLPAGSGSCGVP